MPPLLKASLESQTHTKCRFIQWWAQQPNGAKKRCLFKTVVKVAWSCGLAEST